MRSCQVEKAARRRILAHAYQVAMLPNCGHAPIHFIVNSRRTSCPCPARPSEPPRRLLPAAPAQQWGLQWEWKRGRGRHLNGSLDTGHEAGGREVTQHEPQHRAGAAATTVLQRPLTRRLHLCKRWVAQVHGAPLQQPAQVALADAAWAARGIGQDGGKGRVRCGPGAQTVALTCLRTARLSMHGRRPGTRAGSLCSAVPNENLGG